MHHWPPRHWPRPIASAAASDRRRPQHRSVAGASLSPIPGSPSGWATRRVATGFVLHVKIAAASMSELQSVSPDVLIHLARTLQVPMKGLLATVKLLDEGSTVPFIARYRKESTGNLDEVQIRAIEEKLLYFHELGSRKETILIEEQGKLTDALKAQIDQTLNKSELEDLYLPYKPKRRTKAMIAREKGLEPLADYLCGQEPKGTPLLSRSRTICAVKSLRVRRSKHSRRLS